jgi:signal transduction histidine kinase
LVNSDTKYAGKEDFYSDLDDNGNVVQIELFKTQNPGHSINIRRSKLILDVYNLQKDEFFISKALKFIDLNNNNNKEIYFITAFQNKVYLYCAELNLKKNLFQILQKVEIETFKNYNGIPDVYNYDMVFAGKNVIFDLQAGFSVQPRNTYIFNIETKELKKTPINSISNSELNVYDKGNDFYILPSKVFASGNTISPQNYLSFQKSKNQDTIEIFQKKKDAVYEYGDFSAYTILYDKNLNFAFKPKEYYGWTSISYSDFIYSPKDVYIATCVYNYHDTAFKSKLLLIDLNGNILNETEVHEIYTGIFTDEKKIALWSKHLEIYNINDENLVPEIVEHIDYAFGFHDIDKDQEKEFLAISENKLIVFENNFKHKTEFEILQENMPIFSLIKLYTYSDKQKTYFYFHSNLFYYVFTYEKNKLSILKYPFYTLIFATWFSMLFFLVKINSKRLEHENLKLEQIILERTNEIREKNLVLISQKEEILSQSEELKIQNKHLEELSNFKKTMTDTIIHDLKNPLNIILNQSKDPKIISSGKRMLNLVMNILDVEKYENTQFKLNCEMHSLQQIINQVTENLILYCEQKNNRIISPSDDIEIYADKEILVRILENLLSNAIRFSIPNKDIEILAKKISENRILISVKNYGETIPDEKLPTIFDKYSQAKISDSKNYKSTGLGLTYCKMAIEAHEQEIKVKNIDNIGVEIEFTLQGKVRNTQTKKVINQQKDRISFTPAELDYLSPFIQKLRTTDIYKVSEIINLLNQINNQTHQIEIWKNKLKTAAFSSNSEYFHSLLLISE